VTGHGVHSHTKMGEIAPGLPPQGVKSFFLFGLGTRVEQGTMCYMDGGSDPPMGRGNFEGERGVPLQSIGTLCGHLCKNGWSDRDEWAQGIMC